MTQVNCVECLLPLASSTSVRCELNEDGYIGHVFYRKGTIVWAHASCVTRPDA